MNKLKLSGLASSDKSFSGVQLQTPLLGFVLSEVCFCIYTTWQESIYLRVCRLLPTTRNKFKLGVTSRLTSDHRNIKWRHFCGLTFLVKLQTYRDLEPVPAALS